MRRTALAKRRAGYKRVLRQYDSLGYADTKMIFRTPFTTRSCAMPRDINYLPHTARHLRTTAPSLTHADLLRRVAGLGRAALAESFGGISAAARAAANTMRVLVPPTTNPVTGEELRICIDANCPACGWAERWFSPDRGLFGCSKCSFTSMQRNEPSREVAEYELGQMSGKVHAEVPDQYADDALLATRLAAEILDGAERGYSSRARKRAGVPRTTRFKRDVLLDFWRWIQALSVEETGSMLQIPEIVIRARAGE